MAGRKLCVVLLALAGVACENYERAETVADSRPEAPGASSDGDERAYRAALASDTTADETRFASYRPGGDELRRLAQREVSPQLSRKAEELLVRYREYPLGTEIPFEVDGQQFVARIEEHYHPEGGPLRPWGYHRGISLFAPERD